MAENWDADPNAELLPSSEPLRPAGAEEEAEEGLIPGPPSKSLPAVQVTLKPEANGTVKRTIKTATHDQVQAAQVRRALGGGGGGPIPATAAAADMNAKWLDERARDQVCLGWTIEVRRQLPTRLGKTRLSTTKILFSTPICEMATLKDQVAEACGGGSYQATLLDEAGLARHRVKFTISLDEFPVRPDPGTEEEVPVSDAERLRARKAEIEAEQERVKAETELERIKAQAEVARAEARRSLEGGKHTASPAPEAEAMKSQIAELRQQLAKKEDERRDQDMGRALEKIGDSVRTLAELQAKTLGEVMLKMETMNRESGERLAKLVENIQHRPSSDGSIKEVLGVVTEALRGAGDTRSKAEESVRQTQIDAMKQVVEMAKTSGMKYEKVVESIMQRHLTGDQNGRLEQALGLVRQLKRLAREEFGSEEVEEERADSPWAQILQTLAAAFLGARGAAAPQPALGVPAAVPPLPAPPAAAPSLVSGFAVGHPSLGGPPAPGLPKPAAPPQPSIPDPEAGLKHTITQVCATAAQELNEGGQENNWVDQAIENLPSSFRSRLATVAKDAERVGILRHYCSPAVFASMEAACALPDRYQTFINGLNELAASSAPSQIGAG